MGAGKCAVAHSSPASIKGLFNLMRLQNGRHTMKRLVMVLAATLALLPGCKHGSKLTGTEGQRFSWPCGGDIAVAGQTQSSCTDK